MFEKIVFICLTILGVGTIIAIAIAIPASAERNDRAKTIADNLGCEYLGGNRDQPSIKFLDCNGEIKMIRVK